MRVSWRNAILLALPAAFVNIESAQGAESAPQQPPLAAVRPVTETHFDTTIRDAYRWMEQGLDDPEFVAFLEAQGDYTRRVLGRFGTQRAKLLERIEQLDNAAAQVRTWKRAGEHTFFLETEPGARTASLMVRKPGTRARKLFDPEGYGEHGAHAAIDYFEPAPDGSRVVVGVSLGGSENSVLRIIETASGEVLPDAITRAQLGRPSWRADGESFYYTRLQKLGPAAPPTATYENLRVHLHRLGRDPEQDPAVFGAGVTGFVRITSTPGSSYVVAWHSAGTSARTALYVAAASKAVDNGVAWKQVVNVEDELATVDSAFALHGNDLYLLIDKGSPHRKLVVLNLETDAGVSKARVLASPSDRILEGISAASDGVYIVARNGVQFELLRMPYKSDGKIEKVPLPYAGAITQLHANVLLPGALFGLQSWIRTPAALYYDPKAHAVSDTAIIPEHPADFSGVEAREVEIESADGTKVPLSIVSRRAIKLDGSHPALYEGYGAYGTSFEPQFRANTLAWIEHGGVWAIVHARGGGEYGESWHNAGRKNTKQHTIDDMIAAARYLIHEGYTSAEHLAVRGTSAGGIAVGGAITQHPELFAAAIDNVGITNTLRFQFTRGGAANVPEFGDVNDAEDFRALYAMSAYHHVRDGVRYPAVMGVTGANDPRVPSWMVAEMVARLQAASNGARPMLLRVDFDAGHGSGGSNRIQQEQQLADEWAFILWQTGDPEFSSPEPSPR